MPAVKNPPAPTLGSLKDDGSEMDQATLRKIQEEETQAALQHANRSRRIKAVTKRKRVIPNTPLEPGYAVVADPMGQNPRIIPAIDLLFPRGLAVPVDDEFHSEPVPVGNHYYKIAQGHLKVIRFNPHPLEMLDDAARQSPLFPGALSYRQKDGTSWFPGRQGEFWHPEKNPNRKLRPDHGQDEED